MIEKAKPDFPQSMADSYLQHKVEEVMSKNQGQLEKEKVIETYKPIAEQSLKWYLIRKAIIKDQSIEATKEEIAEFINDKKSENPQQEKEIDRDSYSEGIDFGTIARTARADLDFSISKGKAEDKLREQQYFCSKKLRETFYY